MKKRLDKYSKRPQYAISKLWERKNVRSSKYVFFWVWATTSRFQK